MVAAASWYGATLFVIIKATMIYSEIFTENVKVVVYCLKQTTSILSTIAGVAAGFHSNKIGTKPNS